MKQASNDGRGLPNIVFILADDMGYGDVGCYNYEAKIPTPNMDRVAREGMRFTDAHSCSAVCTPSRYGILTGRNCWRTALRSNVFYGYEPPLIERNRLTVASVLKSAGYRTACVGKWHIGLGYSAKKGEFLDFNCGLPWANAKKEFEEKVDFDSPIEGGPVNLGFDWFYGTSGCPTCQPPYGFIENDRFVITPTEYRISPPLAGRPGMTAPGWDHKEADPRIAGKAVDFIEKQKNSGKPFFLYLASSAPHEPCIENVVPEFARGQSAAGPRGDLVWLFDWMVGRVLDALDRTGLAGNTMVVVTSDNGALPGDRVEGGDMSMLSSYRTYGHKSCGAWRGYKSHIWEGGHREPLLVRWPGSVRPGSASGALVCLNDFFAGFAELAGVRLPDNAGEDSASILPLLRAETPAIRTDLIHHSLTGVFSLRSGPWKCVFETQGSGGFPPPAGGPPEQGKPGQLYNLQEDPQEQVNLWDRMPQVVRGISEQMMQYVHDGRSMPARREATRSFAPWTHGR